MFVDLSTITKSLH